MLLDACTAKQKACSDWLEGESKAWNGLHLRVRGVAWPLLLPPATALRRRPDSSIWWMGSGEGEASAVEGKGGAAVLRPSAHTLPSSAQVREFTGNHRKPLAQLVGEKELLAVLFLQQCCC